MTCLTARSSSLVFLVAFLIVASACADWTPAFGAEELVEAAGSDIDVPGYSVPSFADWNGDGLADLIVGEGGGSEPGHVRIYLNTGTIGAPAFTSPAIYAQGTSGPIQYSGG